jgi:hypothetical protein
LHRCREIVTALYIPYSSYVFIYVQSILKTDVYRFITPGGKFFPLPLDAFVK